MIKVKKYTFCTFFIVNVEIKKGEQYLFGIRLSRVAFLERVLNIQCTK